MAWRPRGFVGIRQAILELTKVRSPEAAIDEYVAPPWPASPGTENDPIRRALTEWDPYKKPRHGNRDTAWLAIEAAREELLQALGDGEIEATALRDDTGEQSPVPVQLWQGTMSLQALKLEEISWTEGSHAFPTSLRTIRGGKIYMSRAILDKFLSVDASLHAARREDTAEQLASASSRGNLDRLQTVKASGGRPPKWDWEAFWVEVVTFVDSAKGLPEDRGDLHRHMCAWFQSTYNDEPSESEIRKRIAKLY